jgi:uncharacterized protein
MSDYIGSHSDKVFRYILLKLAARCNLNCSYCYWFRDESVYEKPKVLTPQAETAFLEKLATHIQRYQIDYFSILFHGGEPLLFGKNRFEAFCGKLRDMEKSLGFELRLSITSNGVLIDAQWAQLLKAFRVAVTISIDGPEQVHDQRRVDLKGRGTFHKVLAALPILAAEDIRPGVLAVCNPHSDPEELCELFVKRLGIRRFDILVPDATHEDKPASIAHYYKKLFDIIYDDYEMGDVHVRWLETVTKGLLGVPSHSESIGYRPVTTCTLLTDGSLEPLDVLRTAGNKATTTSFDIFNHELQEIQLDPLWREVRDASLTLAPVCKQCVYKSACGGGHIGSRWSNANRYNNPSVYCDDIKDIFGHISKRIANDISHDDTVDRVIGLLQS